MKQLKSIKYIILMILLMLLNGCQQQEKVGIQLGLTQLDWFEQSIEEGYQSIQKSRHQQEFLSYYDRNADFVGFVQVGDVIDEIVVHSHDNNDYLRKDFDQQYYRKGTVFMDYRNDFYSQNTIFYGHYVYYDETSMFSPLHLLKEQENYEENKWITLELYDEIRHYEVAAVYYFQVEEMEPKYYLVEYNQIDFDKYLEDIKKVQFYETGVEMSQEDDYLTLQTCVRNRDDLRLIVVGKLVEIDQEW